MNKLPYEIYRKIWDYDITYKEKFNDCMKEMKNILYFNNSITVQVSDYVVDLNNYNLLLEKYELLKHKFFIPDMILRNKYLNKYMIIEYEICKEVNTIFTIHNNFANFIQNIIKK
jgi:hypothetical protein